MPITIFTIGYEGADPERFLTALKAAGVEVLAGLGGTELVALDPVKAGLAGARPSLAP